MDQNTEWKAKLQREITHAETARRAGNEGMARVCARRAAGITIAEYLSRRGLLSQGPSVYDHLRYLTSLSDVSQQVKDTAGHFLIRIDTNRNLPIDLDLVAEARWLARELLDSSI